jgi:hypothetical protein
MKPAERATHTSAPIDGYHDDAEERPLRLDRSALRLDPPVVRFEADRSDAVARN